MEYKYINLFLLFIVVILITMNYNLASRHEQFINHSERHNNNPDIDFSLFDHRV